MSWAEERPGSPAAGVERRGIYDLNQLTAADQLRGRFLISPSEDPRELRRLEEDRIRG